MTQRNHERTPCAVDLKRSQSHIHTSAGLNAPLERPAAGGDSADHLEPQTERGREGGSGREVTAAGRVATTVKGVCV